MFLCRTYSGSAAVEMGLANVVVSDDALDAEVQRWCEELLLLSPQSLRIAKLSLSSSFDSQWSSVLPGESWPGGSRGQVTSSRALQRSSRSGRRASVQTWVVRPRSEGHTSEL